MRPDSSEFPLLDGLFDGILGKLVEPLVIEGLAGPDDRLDLQFEVVFAAFAEVPVGQMKVVPPGLGVLDGVLANIAGKGLHDINAPCLMSIIFYTSTILQF
jgi:hypothetical protein